MAADETQSLEYKSIPNTYQSVVFVDGSNVIHTGDGHKLPLELHNDARFGIRGSNSVFTYKGITVDNTLTIVSTNITTITNSQSSFAGILSSSIGKDINSPNIYVNEVNPTNIKSIVTDGYVKAQYDALTYSVNSLPIPKSNITVNNQSVKFGISNSPKTVVYVIPCEITLNGTDNKDITITATCSNNGVKNFTSSVAKESFTAYYEKWRDNPEPLRIQSGIITYDSTILYSTVIGSFIATKDDDYTITIKTTTTTNTTTTNVTVEIDSDNVLILRR